MIKVLLLLSFMISLLFAAIPEFNNEYDHFPGIFDEIMDDLTVDLVNLMNLDQRNKLIYGSRVKPPLEIIKHLLENAVCDVNAFDSNGCCSLYYALMNNDFEAAELLINSGADVNLYTTTETILSKVACSGNREAVQFLLDHGADINSKGGSSVNPLISAVLSGGIDILNLLIERGCDADAHEIDVALMSKEPSAMMVKYLLELGIVEADLAILRNYWDIFE